MEQESIFIKGARENNLKGFDLSIPRDKLVVITGVSGSGKSSLAFDTLYAEGHRRFAESISSFARQFLGRMTKPAVDFILGVPPAIAVEQKVNTSNPRSTIATTTEIYDYLRLLFAKAGHTYSPISGAEVQCDTPKSVLKYIYSLGEGSVVLVAADVLWSKDSHVERLLDLKERGFSRVVKVSDGLFYRIDQLLSDEIAVDRDYKVLIDRIVVEREGDADFEARALDSIGTAFKEGDGHIWVGAADNIKPFSSLFESDGMIFEMPQENLFSYNSPIGACPTCGGYGKIIGIDEQLVVPNPTLSVYEGAVVCWRGEVMKWFYEQFIENAYKCNFPIHKPYKELSKEERYLIWNGSEHFEGINQFFDWVRKNRYKIQFKYILSRYSGKTTCHDCEGSRLRKEALYVKVGGKNIAELMDMSIKELVNFFNTLELDEYDREIAHRPLQEIMTRLGYMMNVGLGYLTLSRHSNTLSGGESQRINLVTSLGNNLVGSLYILDEPSIGLHSKDTLRLIDVLKQLRDLGNTVVVVEHDPDIIAAADMLIDVGPKAGTYGGEIVYQGPPVAATDADISRSLTLDYISGRRSQYIPQKRGDAKYHIEICGAAEHNLKNIDVSFPLRRLVVVTGVSGSGKSSLVGDILYPALYRHINQLGNQPGAYKELRGDLSRISSVEYVDQNPLGKSSRSNPVTYLKVYDDIRKLFSDQPYAKLNGYGHSHFSFNIDGGRCPECQGDGVIHIQMQFMADVTMVCESCGGARFIPDILQVRYHGKNISDVLNMSVSEAVEFFSSKEEPHAKRIAEKLQPLVDVGLSYLQLGQSSSTLSGGECQRVKLASFLGKESKRDSILFIFDEPTTGLHFYDIEKLLKAFEALIAKGHSIIVVEHNLDIIRAADHIIELGPEAGYGGGYVIYEGTPEELSKHPEIPTGAALAQITT